MKLGVFTPVFAGLDTAAMLKKVKAFKGIEALELGTGGWPGSDHIDLARLKDPRHAREYRQVITDAGLSISALSCHSNPLHPDPSVAKAADEVFRQTVCLAERLEVPVVVTYPRIWVMLAKRKYESLWACTSSTPQMPAYDMIVEPLKNDDSRGDPRKSGLNYFTAADVRAAG